jgi:hypothetical protein
MPKHKSQRSGIENGSKNEGNEYRKAMQMKMGVALLTGVTLMHL